MLRIFCLSACLAQFALMAQARAADNDATELQSILALQQQQFNELKGQLRAVPPNPWHDVPYTGSGVAEVKSKVKCRVVDDRIEFLGYIYDPNNIKTREIIAWLPEACRPKYDHVVELKYKWAKADVATGAKLYMDQQGRMIFTVIPFAKGTMKIYFTNLSISKSTT